MDNNLLKFALKVWLISIIVIAISLVAVIIWQDLSSAEEVCEKVYFIKYWIGYGGYRSNTSFIYLEKEGNIIKHRELYNTKIYFTDEPTGYIEIIKDRWYNDTVTKIYLPKNKEE